MIFNENYDKVLWLLVVSNKKDSEKICKLINYIPEEVYVDIQKAIVDYYNNDLDDKDGVIFKTTLSGIGDFDCYITVKIDMGRLYLNLYRWLEEDEKFRIEEEYELILKDISMKTMDDMLYLDKECIGKYSSEVNSIDLFQYGTYVDTYMYDRSFSLKKVPFGYVVSSFLGKLCLSRKYVNVNKNMPEEIFVSDFRNEDKVKETIKNRKRIRKK